MKILIFGKGYIGTRCHGAWEGSVLSEAMVNSKEDALAEIERHSPDAVFNAAGVKGRPNVDWCDTHQMEAIRGNTILPLILADACRETGVYLLHIGSGCVFYGESEREDGSWSEYDHANPEPTYTRAKYAADLTLSTLPNIGVGRIRLPIDHVPSSGNLIDKVASFPKVIDVKNSVTVIDDMVKAFYEIMEKKGEGIFHVTNPGVMTHRQLMAMYEEYVDPSHSNEWITNAELKELGLVSKGRSNNVLSSSRLEEIGVHMRHVDEALRDTMQKYAMARKAMGAVDKSLVLKA